MRRAAFTFVEVLIALALCALLVATVSSALIHLTRIERRTTLLREAPFHLQTLACQSYLDLAPVADLPAGLPPAWSAQSQTEVTEDDEQQTPWLCWRLAVADDPAFAYTLSLRDGLGPWPGE